MNTTKNQTENRAQPALGNPAASDNRRRYYSPPLLGILCCLPLPFLMAFVGGIISVNDGPTIISPAVALFVIGIFVCLIVIILNVIVMISRFGSESSANRAAFFVTAIPIMAVVGIPLCGQLFTTVSLHFSGTASYEYSELTFAGYKTTISAHCFRQEPLYFEIPQCPGKKFSTATVTESEISAVALDSKLTDFESIYQLGNGSTIEFRETKYWQLDFGDPGFAVSQTPTGESVTIPFSLHRVRQVFGSPNRVH